MIITPHFLVGAALGTMVKSLPVAFALGVGSHLILDAIPHVDPGTFQEIIRGRWPRWFYYFTILDFAATFLIIYFFRHRPDFSLIIAGGLGGILIDIIDNIPFPVLDEWPVFKQVHLVHQAFHYYIKKENWYWGIIGQVIVIGGSLWFLLRKF